MRWRCSAGLVVIVLSSCTSAAVAAEPASKRLDLAYVTDDFFAAVVIHPARLLKSPLAEALPIAPWPRWLKERTLIELEQIDQAILLLPRPGKGIIYQAGGVVRFREPVVNKGFVESLVKPLAVGVLADVTHAGKTYWTAPGAREMAVHAPDARTLVFANEDCLKAMLDGSGPRGGLVERLGAVAADDDLAFVAEMEPLRKLLGDLQTYFRGDAATPFVFASVIAARLKAATIAIRIAGEPRLHAELEAQDDNSAELVNDVLRGSAAMARVAAASIPGLVKATDGEDPLRRMQLRSSQLALDAILKDAKITRTERRVLVECRAPARVVRLLDGMWLAQSAASLRVLGLAMHNFHDVYGALPAHANYSKAGKPLLSWRVHLLPFLDLNSLHQQFRLDEPWDSPHNKKLIERMPPVFASPGKVFAAGETCYVVPTTAGDGKYHALFGQRPKSMEKGPPLGNPFGVVKDGLSNTIMIVEADPKAAVIWTKPDDWQVNFDEPRKGLFGRRKGFVLALFGDASIRPLPETVAEESLRRMIGCDDGEIFQIPDYVPDDAIDD